MMPYAYDDFNMIVQAFERGEHPALYVRDIRSYEGIHRRILSALERLHDHVEVVIRIRHHVRGELRAWIQLLEPGLESKIPEIAVGIPGCFEQLGPLTDRRSDDRRDVA